MMTNHITNLIRKLVPQPPTCIEDIYPCLVGQRERNIERMNASRVQGEEDDADTSRLALPNHQEE